MRSIVISAVSAVALLSGAALANDQAAQSSTSGVTAGAERNMDCTPGTSDPDCDEVTTGPLGENDHSAGATSGSAGSTAGTTGSAGATESTGSTAGGTGSTAGSGASASGGASSADD